MSRERDHKKALRGELPKGYELVKIRNGHLAVRCPDGAELRDGKGMPFRMAFSPGAGAQTRTDAVRLRRALEAQGG